MKLVKQFSDKLDKLLLSTERKADLLAKYLAADSKAESEMNEYFEIIPPELDKKKKGKSKSNIKRKNPEAKYVAKNENYFATKGKSFDSRARPTIDIHIESDETLDKKYFKNS
jgi:hypothetical protein